MIILSKKVDMETRMKCFYYTTENTNDTISNIGGKPFKRNMILKLLLNAFFFFWKSIHLQVNFG